MLRAACTLLTLTTAACAPLGAREIEKTSLQGIVCGSTTQAELQERFGPPSFLLPEERIAGWRFEQQRGGGFPTLRPVAAEKGLWKWREADHSLIVEFDERNVVRRLSLVRLW